MPQNVVDVVNKASQPVRDALLIISAGWFMAVQGGFLQGPVQRTNPQVMDTLSRSTFYDISEQTEDLWKWHNDGRDPNGGFLWYGKALEPLMQKMLNEERAQTELLRQIVQNGHS